MRSSRAARHECPSVSASVGRSSASRLLAHRDHGGQHSRGLPRYSAGTGCASFGRSALEVESAPRIAQEGILAAQSIACDFGGFLADAPGRTGTLTQYSFTSWDVSQANVLILYFQGTTGTDVIAITYELSGDQLVRYQLVERRDDHDRPTRYGLLCRLKPENTGQAMIQITVTFRYLYVHLHLDRYQPDMMRRHQPHPRRGYSLTVVLMFLILIFALWSTVYRSTSACSASRPTASCSKPATRER